MDVPSTPSLGGYVKRTAATIAIAGRSTRELKDEVRMAIVKRSTTRAVRRRWARASSTRTSGRSGPPDNFR